MELPDLLRELFGRVAEHVHAIAADLDAEQLASRPGPEANSIGWLLWHLTRVLDHHGAELMGVDQVWVDGGWAARFGLEADASDIGYGHTSAEVARVRPEGAGAVTDYFDAVWARTKPFLATVTAADLDRVVDRRWDPPVTLGVRLVSIADDGIQHAGQAAFVKGLLGWG